MKSIDTIKLDLFQPFVETMNELYEKYGEEFVKLNGLHLDNLNFTTYINGFLKADNVASISVDSNANVASKDVCTMLSDMVKPHTKLLGYNKIFYEMTKKYGLDRAKQWLEMDFSGGLYMHDATSASFKSYCMAYTVSDLAERGLYFIQDYGDKPAKHLETFVNHVIEFVSYASNRTSGAVGLPDVIPYMYYFWWKDMQEDYLGIHSTGNDNKYRENAIEHFIYSLNKHFVRNSSECSFTNVSIFDRPYLEEIFGGKTFPDGEFMIDHIDGIVEFQREFMNQVSRIREDLFFTFPVLTYAILYKDGKFVDEEFARWANKHNMKWCDSNFFISSDITSLSNCCRLISNVDTLSGFQNSIGGSALKIGSVKVNTINLNRIALRTSTQDEYIEELEKRVIISAEVLDVVRHIIQRNIEKGLLPNFTHKLVEMQNCYNTIGINGLFEAVENFGGIEIDEFGNHSYNKNGEEFTTRIFKTINSVKDKWAKDHNCDYKINVEQIPAESCAQKFARKDALLYRDRVSTHMYGNQFIPLAKKCSISEKIRIGAMFANEVNGGCIEHINIEGDFASEEQAWDMLNNIAKQGVLYFAYNKRISICANGHCFFGETCPKCGSKKVDTIQRIVGFLTKSSTYSQHRKKEFKQRTWFDFDEN